jgi:O-acetyl-ADP-ribose deacetylase (regulator of RNase III)
MIKLIKGDITQIQVDAIVNAAKPSLMGGGGVDGAIHFAGGRKILEECMAYTEENGYLFQGEAMITTGGNLPAKYVIHTVGPVWSGGHNNESLYLENAYYNSLKLASDYDLQSVAFPNISTGVYGFPKDLAAEIAISVVKDFLTEQDTVKEVIFVCFDDENYEIYKEILYNSGS